MKTAKDVLGGGTGEKQAVEGRVIDGEFGHHGSWVTREVD